MTKDSTRVSKVIEGPRTAMPCEMQEATSSALRTEQLRDQCARVHALTTSIKRRKKKRASLNKKYPLSDDQIVK